MKPAVITGIAIGLILLLPTACGPAPAATPVALLPSPTQTEEPRATPTSTHTPVPTATSTPIPTATATPTSTLAATPTSTATRRSTSTPVPPKLQTLGSVFNGCGDSIAMMRADNAFNGPFRSAFDEGHGHVDVEVPTGCNGYETVREVSAPVSGRIRPYHLGIHLYLDRGVYISGTVKALEFAGIRNPDLDRIGDTWIDIGHIMNSVAGKVEKGERIADCDPSTQNDPPLIIAYKVFLSYSGTEYMLSPSLFDNDVPLPCSPTARHDCVPESFDYPP